MADLYRVDSPIKRDQRNNLNLTFEDILNRFNNLQRQINILAGDNDVDELINRIADALNNSESTLEDLQTALTSAQQEISAIITATTKAINATDAANQATTDATHLINDMTVLQTDLEQLQTSLNRIITDATQATTAANTATNNTTQATLEAQQATTDADNAAIRANDAADAIEGWGQAVPYQTGTYKRNNIVTYEGSTYQSLVDGNTSLPTDNTKWIVLARKGLDGQGAVQTVNDKSPDGEGNVEIGIADIDNLNVVLNTKTNNEELTALEQIVYTQFDDQAIKDITVNAGEHLVDSTVKSPVNVKRIDGKTIVNLPPLFDSGVWNINAKATVSAPNKLTLVTSVNFDLSKCTLTVKPSTQYTVSAVVSGSIAYVAVKLFTSNGTLIGEEKNTYYQTGSQHVLTFTTTADTSYIELSLSNSGTGTFTFENVSLNEGSQVLPFVANVKGLTNPTIANETNGTSLVVPTTLYDGEYVEQNANGELVKYKKWQEKVLSGDLTWYYNGKGTGFKQISTLISDAKGASTFDDNSSIVVNFDGKIINVSDPALRADAHYINSQNKYLILSIPNIVSGWSESYQPTPEEMKALALGWSMKQSDGNMYSSGAKYWTRLNETVYGAGWLTEKAVNTVPTTIADATPTAKAFTPNHLIYELATPVQEVIQPYGDLTLEKGDNNVKVYAGRIVNEKAKPLRESNGVYNINNGNPSYEGTLLRRKSKKILNIFKNNTKDTALWMLYDYTTTSAGALAQLLNGSLFDQTASYTVDYEPLYTWEITAPIDNVQLQYFETLQAVTSELVHDVSKHQDTIKRMLENVVNDGEGLVWITATLLNGFTGYVYYAKDSQNNVYIRLSVANENVPGTNLQVCKLPSAFLPHDSVIIPVGKADGSIQPGLLVYNALQGIISQSNSGFSVGQSVYGSVIYKAKE